MKCTLFLLGVVLPFMLISNTNKVEGLVGGQVTTTGQSPFHVAIFLPNAELCGGTIINQNHVVTAARCMLTVQGHLLPANQVTVRAGSLNLNDGGVLLNVIALFPHPQFNLFTNENNVAVIRTAVNFQFPGGPNPNIAAIPALTEHIVTDNTNCFLNGWNPTLQVPNPALQRLVVPILNRDQVCNTVAVHTGRVGESMLCAGSTAANNGACPAAHGGGLICNNQLTGVLTGAFACGAINSPPIFTQVRIHRTWIQQQLTRTQIPPAGPTPTPVPVPGNQTEPNDNSGSSKAITSLFVLLTSIYVAFANI